MLLLSSCHNYHGIIIIEEDSDELVASTLIQVTTCGVPARGMRSRESVTINRHLSIVVSTDYG